MQITAESKVADIAVRHPATIKVFQRHGIDFCCGGRVPLHEACELRGIDAQALLADLRAAKFSGEEDLDWIDRSLEELALHIQERFHEPLRLELPRLGQMLAKVVDRHGDRLPQTLLPLRDVFERMQRELIDHMRREDVVLFPLISELEHLERSVEPAAAERIRPIVARMIAEHDIVGQALEVMRNLTKGYEAPDWACPTFVGLYHGLAELERDMQIHVHLENSVLFPRALGESVGSIS